MSFTEARSVIEGRLHVWLHAYSGIDVLAELNKMERWIEANPNRSKKNYNRFIVNWLNRAHINLANANTRYSNFGRQQIFTDQNGNRYKVSVEGSRIYF